MTLRMLLKGNSPQHIFSFHSVFAFYFLPSRFRTVIRDVGHFPCVGIRAGIYSGDSSAKVLCLPSNTCLLVEKLEGQLLQ